MKQISEKETIGTSYHDANITATVGDLRKVLGEPGFAENSGSDKVNYMWYMETSEGKKFTVYDYKEGSAITDDEEIKFNIGAFSRSDSISAYYEITAALRELKNKVTAQAENRIYRTKEKKQAHAQNMPSLVEVMEMPLEQQLEVEKERYNGLMNKYQRMRQQFVICIAALEETEKQLKGLNSKVLPKIILDAKKAL